MLTETKIQQRIAKRDTISHDVLKLAVQENIDAAQKSQKEGLKLALRLVEQNTNAAVDRLRRIRKDEKAALEQLTKFSEAGEAFAKTADIEAYAKAIFSGGSSYAQEDFLRQFRGTLITLE